MAERPLAFYTTDWSYVKRLEAALECIAEDEGRRPGLKMSRRQMIEVAKGAING